MVWVLILLICSPAGAGELAVVINPETPVNSLKKADVKKMFLGKKTLWENGENILPVVLKSGPLHEVFLKELIEKTPLQFSMYWKRIIFTGRGIGPKSFETESELLKYVAETKGAVGYADASASFGDVKVVPLE
jgi:ABC-type phosphate transport system substrate-binding protein